MVEVISGFGLSLPGRVVLQSLSPDLLNQLLVRIAAIHV